MRDDYPSPTRVAERSSLDAADLDQLVAGLAGPDARAVVVVDPTPIPLRTALVDGLAARRDTVVLDGVRPDPRTDDVTALARAVAGRPVDVVVGIGGGSTLDAAKGLAILLDGGGDLADYLGPAPARAMTPRRVRTALLPTTAGTGAEVTRFAVFTTPTGRKVSLVHDRLRPDVAILAPALTHTLPPAGTAATGLDALSHALEALWNRNATPASDDLAIAAAAAVLGAIETAWESARAFPTDGATAGRAALLRAACRAGVAFDRTGTAAVHALSFVLSEEWGVPHGAACAFFLPAVLARNARLPAVRAKLARVSERLGLDGGDPVATLHGRIATLTARLGLATTFAALGVERPTAALLPLFDRALDDPKLANNLPPMTEADISILIAAHNDHRGV